MNPLIAKSRALLAAATPGPWKLHETGAIRTEQPTAFGIPGVDEHFKDHKRWCAFVGDKVENGDFIASAPELVAQLCEALERAEAVCEAAGFVANEMEMLMLDYHAPAFKGMDLIRQCEPLLRVNLKVWRSARDAGREP